MPRGRWEIVTEDNMNGTTERLAVPGGWLYKIIWKHEMVVLFVAEAPTTTEEKK